jgi:nucleotide-binding universal stress UspA family protein
MKRILVAVDFSECSVNALEHAITIANHASADLDMIYVAKPDSSRDLFTEGAETLKAMVRDRFDEIVEKYQPHMSKHKLGYIIREGKVYKEIVKEAEHKDVFLVMAGTHGSSGFEEFWIGSNANRLVSALTKPVITIRGGVNIKRTLSKIILPVDSTPETRQKVPFTAYIAKIFNAQVHVLKVYSSDVDIVKRTVDSYSEQVVKHLQEEKIDFVVATLEAENITDTTIEYALKHDANLISIMTEQETTARNLLLGPYAQQMVNHCPIPVLSIHPQEMLVSLAR